MKRILLSGYYGFSNAGDEAVLSSMLNSLRASLQDIEITVFSANPQETMVRQGVRAVSRRHLPTVIKEILRSDVLLSGGGGLLQDATSSRSLYYYLGIVFLAKLFGKKVMFFANGIGPVRRPFNRWLLKKIVSQVELITVRDEGSQKELEALKVAGPKVEVTSDPALLLQPASRERVEEICRSEGIQKEGKPLVCFSVRQWGLDKNYLNVLTRVADYVQDSQGARAVFFPMQYPADLKVSEEVASRMRVPGLVIRGKYSAEEILALVQKMDFMVGMRLHSLIFAAVSRVPMLGLIYDPKVANFLTQVAQPKAGMVTKIGYEQIQTAFDQAWRQKEALRQALDKNVPLLQRKAQDNMKLVKQLIENNGER